MLYNPEGIYVWDTWYFNIENELHCIHLQILRPGSTRSEKLSGVLGQAYTTDLVHWKELPPALMRGEAGTYDDEELWTGCVIEHEGTYYLYYTARSSVERGNVNRIALATSKDGVRWERYPGNPIIIPDSEYYVNEFAPLDIYHHGQPIVDCRDMCVLKSPDGHGFIGYFAARRPADTNAESSVIALVRSEDLIHWEQEPPCFTPDRFGCVEVPEVFFLNGKYYMLCLTGNPYGSRGGFSDPLLREGTVYASSDSPYGPFIMDETDNTLIGSVNHQGYSVKTALFNGERVMFYTQGEMKAGCHHGCISLPSLLKTDGEGHLYAAYHPLISENYLPDTLGRVMDNSSGIWGSRCKYEADDNNHTVKCEKDWAVVPFEGIKGNFMLECTLTPDCAGAGIACRLGESIMGVTPLVYLDAERGRTAFTTLREFPDIEYRTFPVKKGRAYRLRLIVTGNVFMLYIDDRLIMQLYDLPAKEGHIALYCERGTATFRDLTIYAEKNG